MLSPFSFFEKRLDPHLPKKMLLIPNTNTNADNNRIGTLFDSSEIFSSHLLLHVLLLAINHARLAIFNMDTN